MTALESPPDRRLGELFEQWRRDIVSVPIPQLVDLATAVSIVRGGSMCRADASPDEAPTR